MTAVDYVVNLVLSGILIVGAYQFYFFTQRHPLRPARVLHSPLDEKIPFVAWWSWVYSFLYYPAILYLNWLLPVSTPPHWRSVNTGKTASEKFLLFVQKFDQSTNCFPSMHVSVAMLTAMYAYPSMGAVAFAFPVLIALSCMFTKQHYLMDLPAGAILGWLVFKLYGWLMLG